MEKEKAREKEKEIDRAKEKKNVKCQMLQVWFV